MINTNLNITNPPFTRQEYSHQNKEKDSITLDNELSDNEEKQIRELKKIDQEVKRHEQAHLAAAADLARGGASFEYTQGPDGKKYATAGEVNIDVSPISGDPQATIRKMQQVRRAALAPSDPSGQDRAVAAKAAREEAKARAELSNPNNKENSNSSRLDAYNKEFEQSRFSFVI